jgi:uncharacterized protein (TIGR02099 family)
VHVDARFSHALLKGAGDWQGWAGRLRLQSEGLKLPAWVAAGVELMPQFKALPIRVHSGRLETQTEIRFEKGVLKRIDTESAVHQLEWGHPSGGTWHIEHHAIAGQWQQQGIQQQLQLNKWIWQNTAHSIPQHIDRVSLFWKNKQLDKIDIAASALSLSEIHTGIQAAFQFGRTTLPTVWPSSMAGKLRDVVVHWQRPDLKMVPAQWLISDVLKTLQAQFRLEGVHYTNGAGIALKGLTADVAWRKEQGGTVCLPRQALAFQWLAMWPQHPLQFNAFEGDMTLQMPSGVGQPWQVNMTSLRFGNADAQGSLRGTWQGGVVGQSGLVDLQGHLDHAQLAAVWRYIPKIIDDEVITHLQHSALNGTAKDVSMVLKGRLKDFPFERPEQGEFRVDIPIYAAQYRPEITWPRFENIDGAVQFDRNHLNFSVQQANVHDVTIGPVTGHIDALGESSAHLRINGVANGALSGFFSYFHASPLGHFGGNVTPQIRADGSGQLRLNLDIPLINPEEAHVDGQLNFSTPTLSVLPTLPLFNKVNGTLNITEKGIQFLPTKAQFLGGEVRLEGGSHQDGSIQLRANGLATAEGLRTVYPGTVLENLMRGITGQLHYRTMISAQSGHRSVQVDSDGQGLVLNWPAPIGQSPQAFKVHWEQFDGHDADQRDARETLKAQWGEHLNAVFEQSGTGKAWELRGGIGIGEAAALPLEGHQAVWVNVRLPELDVDAWRAMVAQSGLMPAKSSLAHTVDIPSWFPSQVAVTLGQLTAGGRTWPAFSATIHREAAQWHAEIDSDRIKGGLSWSPSGVDSPFGALRARLKTLNVPETPEHERQVVAQMLEERSEQVPSIDVQVDDFRFDGKKLGRLELQARSQLNQGSPEWVLDALTLEQPAALLQARGTWRIPRKLSEVDEPRRTTVDFRLGIRDGGELLDHLGLPQTLADGTGQLEGRVQWLGSPLALDIPSLRGKMVLALDKGRFLPVDPGLAKLLGVLSLQGLTRLAIFDLPGLAEKGLAFDSIKASGIFEKGLLKTNDFVMQSPQASISLQGSANLIEETQLIDVLVLPNVNAGSASLAYSLVNPALGLGSLFAQLLFSDQVAQAFSQEWRIYGSWEEPQIERLDAKP